jgi:hypothetical protein
MADPIYTDYTPASIDDGVDVDDVGLGVDDDVDSPLLVLSDKEALQLKKKRYYAEVRDSVLRTFTGAQQPMNVMRLSAHGEHQFVTMTRSQILEAATAAPLRAAVRLQRVNQASARRASLGATSPPLMANAATPLTTVVAGERTPSAVPTDTLQAPTSNVRFADDTAGLATSASSDSLLSMRRPSRSLRGPPLLDYNDVIDASSLSQSEYTAALKGALLPRDMRVLDSQFLASNDQAVLVRRHAFVINLCKFSETRVLLRVLCLLIFASHLIARLFYQTNFLQTGSSPS